MSLTKSALRKIASKAADKRTDRQARQCPARPSNRQCKRTVKAGAGADATCGRVDCAEWMLAQDEATVKSLLGIG